MLDKLTVCLFETIKENSIKYDDDKQILEGAIQVDLSEVKSENEIEKRLNSIISTSFNQEMQQYVQVKLSYDFTLIELSFKLQNVR